MIRSLLCVPLLYFCACNEAIEPINLAAAEDYYPIDLETYRVYEVNQITYNLAGSDTLDFYLKEEFIDSIVTSSGQVSYVLRRSITQDTSAGWEVDSLWTVRRQNNGIVVVENNTPFKKLSSPVVIGTNWDGNAFNTQPTQTYYYENDLTSPFDSLGTIKVIIEDIPRDFIQQDERYEVYAQGIGLVEKNYIALKFCDTCGESGVVNAGIQLSQVLIAYGEK